MDMTTPENGSPVLNVVSRMSPTFTPSRLRGSKRRRRAPVGSSDGICEDCTTATGSLHTATAEGGGSWIVILRLPGGPSVCTKQDNLRHRPLSGRNLAGNCDQYCCGRLGGKSSFWIGPLWTVTKLRLGCFCSLNSRKILFQQQSGRVCGIVDAIGICGVVNKLQSRQFLEHWFSYSFRAFRGLGAFSSAEPQLAS